MHNFIYENHRCFGCWSVYLETLRAYLSVPCPGATFQSLGNIPTDRKWSVLYPWVVQLAWSPYSWYVIAVQQSFTAFKSVSDVESVILFISALCIRHTECIPESYDICEIVTITEFLLHWGKADKVLYEIESRKIATYCIARFWNMTDIMFS